MPRCATASRLRHLLSHCAGLPEAGLSWQEPPGYPPGTQRWYSNAGYVQAARLLEAASGMSCADYLAEAVLAPLGMDASLGLNEADAPRAARVWQAGRYGEGELFNSEKFRRDAPPQGGGFASARAYGAFLSCLLAGGDAGGGRALLAEETVEEMLAPQFGPLPGGVGGVGEWPDLCWGLGFDVRGQRQPHWSGDDAERAGGQSLRRLGHARLARPRARAGPRRARQSRDVRRLVARAMGRSRRCGDRSGRSGVDTAMKRIRTRPGAGPEAFDELVEAHLGDVHRYLVYLTGDRAAGRGSHGRRLRAGLEGARSLRPAPGGPAQLAALDRTLLRARPPARREAPRARASGSRHCASPSAPRPMRPACATATRPHSRPVSAA